jgi:hypothetical protein
MLLPSVVLSAIAVVLVVGAMVLARWRRREAVGLTMAAVGLIGIGIGLPFGRALDQVEQLERAIQQPLTTAAVEQKLLTTLFPNGVIQTALPDDRTVCHDWTFGGSRYSDGCPVATLLADYTPVSAPRPGDIVVYWSDAGDPAHSGIVRAVGSEGLVVIESKWGHLGRYLHLTAISHFPSRFTYHRRRADRSLPSDGVAEAPAIGKPGVRGAD